MKDFCYGQQEFVLLPEQLNFQLFLDYMFLTLASIICKTVCKGMLVKKIRGSHDGDKEKERNITTNHKDNQPAKTLQSQNTNASELPDNLGTRVTTEDASAAFSIPSYPDKPFRYASETAT